jgi:autotransporter-associated beta strand protein
LDGNSSNNFSSADQAIIYSCWEQMSVYYAIFDVNVTTIQPNLYTTPTAWDCIGANISGGHTATGSFPDGSPASFNESSDASNRVSGIAHEIGHNFGLSHQSTYNLSGQLTAEYSSGSDVLHVPIMGLDAEGEGYSDSAGSIDIWDLGHPDYSPSALQDDRGVIAGEIAYWGHFFDTSYTGDGYAPDDYGGTIATATPLVVNGCVQSITGVIERLTDTDAFSFTVTAAGQYVIAAGRVPPSSVALKLSVYNSSGTLLASADGNNPQGWPLATTNDQELSMSLAPGTYYAIVGSQGNYSDVGEYQVTVAPMASGWSAHDVGIAGVPGTASYAAGTSTMTVSGSGTQIGGTADGLQLAYQTLQGNGTIIARVTQLNTADPSAEAGVMVRESLASDATDVAILAAAQNGPQMLWRGATGGSTATSDAASASFTPIWVELQRQGNLFSAYTSSDGLTWTLAGTATVAMGQTVYVGLASCGQQLNTATFDNISLSGHLDPGPTLDALAAPTGLAVTGTTATTAALSWNCVSGAAGYVIERSSDGVTYAQVGTTASGVTTFTDTCLAGGQGYFYRVRAKDGSGGESPPSSTVNPVTRAGAVTNLTVTSYQNSYILNWTPVTGGTSYEIERSANGSSPWTVLYTVGQNIPSWQDTSAGTLDYYQVVTLDALGAASTSAVAYYSSTGPTVAASAAAAPSTVTGTTTALSVSGADSGGPAGAANFLTYTWVTTAQPSGAATPRFSCNGTNKAQNTTATFYQVGNYTFQVTITDGEGLTATSSVSVTVSQTLTSIAVAPAGGLSAGGTLQFAATGLDQFGNALSSQPGFTWSTTGPGTISGSGVFTPAPAGGSGTVVATSSPLSGSISTTSGMSGTGALTLTAGAMVLIGANSYTGGTVVTGGTLYVISPTALPCGQGLTVGAGGVVVLGCNAPLKNATIASAPAALSGLERNAEALAAGPSVSAKDASSGKLVLTPATDDRVTGPLAASSPSVFLLSFPAALAQAAAAKVLQGARPADTSADDAHEAVGAILARFWT